MTEPGNDRRDRTIGEMIRSARLDTGLSQRQLAARLQRLAGNYAIDQPYVSRWENDGRIPHYWLPYLAAALDVPLAVLERGVREARRRRLSDDESS